MLFAEFDMEAELAAEREAGWEAGQEIGWEAGRKEQNLAIAKNALAEGASPEFVRKITGLDLETIARLSST
jgi:predicted transposase YdaD